MNRFGSTIAAIIGAAILAVSVNFNANAASSAKDEITAVENKIIAAKNADEVMRYYDKREIVLYDFVPPLEYKGADAVRGDLNNFFNNAKDAKGEFLELVVVTDGRMGMARSLQHFTWKDKDGKPMEANLRVTDVLHKVDGQWKVIHSHVSVPVDPVTDKAIMQSK